MKSNLVKLLLVTHSSSKTGGAEDDYERLLKFFSGKSDKYILHGVFPEGYRSHIYKTYCSKWINYSIPWLPLYGNNYYRYFKYFLRVVYDAYFLSKKIKWPDYDIIIINVSVILAPIVISKLKKRSSIIFIRETIQHKTIKKIYYKIISKLGTYFIAVSDFNKNEFKSITHNNNILTLYSSIEDNAGNEEITNEFYREKISPYVLQLTGDSSVFKVMHNASILPLKNQLLVLESAAKIINDYKIQDIVFFFLGEYNEKDEYYLKLLDFIHENNLQKHCFFLGTLEKQLVYGMYKNIDCVILSSVIEGMPLVLVEALKFGKPFVSTSVGGVTEIIENYKNGILVEFCPESIIKAVFDLKNDKYLYESISENAKMTFLKRFNLKANLEKIDDVISLLKYKV